MSLEAHVTREHHETNHHLHTDNLSTILEVAESNNKTNSNNMDHDNRATQPSVCQLKLGSQLNETNLSFLPSEEKDLSRRIIRPYMKPETIVDHGINSDLPHSGVKNGNSSLSITEGLSDSHATNSFNSRSSDLSHTNERRTRRVGKTKNVFVSELTMDVKAPQTKNSASRGELNVSSHGTNSQNIIQSMELTESQKVKNPPLEMATLVFDQSAVNGGKNAPESLKLRKLHVRLPSIASINSIGNGQNLNPGAILQDSTKSYSAVNITSQTNAAISESNPGTIETVKDTVKDLSSSDANFFEKEPFIENPKTQTTFTQSHQKGTQPLLDASKSSEGHTALFLKQANKDKTRRDSVSAMPSRAHRKQSPVKQRRVSLAPNPHIPKRRTSIKDQLTIIKPHVQQSHGKSKLNFPNSIKELLRNEGLADCHVHEDTVTISCPIYTVKKGDRVISLTDWVTLESAVHRNHPGLLVVKSPSTSATSVASIEVSTIGLTASSPEITQTTELASTMPPSNTHDVVKHIDCDIDDKNITDTKVNKNLEPINVCINHMTNNPENFEIQLTGCKTVGQYAHIETLQVLLAKHEAIQCVFNAMQQFPDKDELHKTACASILQMASSSEANCEMICKCDGISILINTLRCYCDNINVTRTILTIFGYISATEELCFDMIQHCVHSDVMGAMSRHSQDAHVVKQCCFILGNLVITEDTAKQIMLVGGVHTIISVMYKFHDNHTILENGCRALGSFAAFDNSCLDVAQAGGTKTVLSVLEQTNDDVTVQECALWALACLTSMGDTCEELVELDGVDTLLTSIERYGEEETIQEYGVRIICNLAVLDTTSAHMSCNRVLHILIDQLTQYPENLGILDHALSALSHTLLTIENQRLLLNKDGVRKVVEAMATFPEHNGVQEHGCRILGNMGVYEVLRKETEASGASRAVISAMLSLQMSTEIQEYGCMALMNLTADVQVNKIQVMKNGGVSALLTCIRNFENDTCMLLGALKALGNIISLEGVCHDVLDDNGLRTIITVSNRNIDSIEIQTFCSMILCGLSALTDLPFEMTESIDDTLLRILGECCSNADICLYFCQTMENIITTENGYRIFIKDDRLPVILQCMSKFIYHADIQQAGCKIIAILAMGCESTGLITPEAVDGILQVMRTFKSHTELQIICCGAISCLLENDCDVDKVIIQNGGIDCISTALELHPTEHRLHVLALMVLASLAPIVKGDKVDEVHRIVIMAMGRFMENHEIQSYGCTAICRLQLNGDDMEVDNILSSVRHALRRHSSQGDVLKSAGSLLRRMSEAGHAEGVDGVLGSALPNLPDFFWRTVKQTKPNKLC